MNLLKQLWNWLVRKTSTTPKLAVVESAPATIDIEEEKRVQELFLCLARTAGVKNKDLESTNAAELFVQWYEGKSTEQEVLQAIPEFLNHHGGTLNAKFTGKF